MAAGKNVLYLFDVDGTLTEPRQVISQELKQFLLDTVITKVKVGLVSGSDYKKIVEQLGGEDVAAEFHYLFCENGLMHYQKGKLVSKESILEAIGETTLQKLINFCLHYMSELELPAKRGNFIEFRSGMVNVSPVGRSCTQPERERFVAYDATHKVRETMVKALQKEFQDSGLTFALGGQISIDVFPRGWDKTYCLRHVDEARFDEIHFFGDKTEVGGNDYEIYNDSRTIGHRVTSPKDTKEKLLQCLNTLR